MTTLFGAALQQCGLSTREAADYFSVSHDTVLSWSSGRRRAPDGAWTALRHLYHADDLLQWNTATTIASCARIVLNSDEPASSLID